MTILVTGGAGFIGSNFVREWLAVSDETVVNLDKLTYAGHPENLASLKDDPRHVFVEGDIGDLELVMRLLQEYRVRAVINFAAETHVDRSIFRMEDFVETNVLGTTRLLEACRHYYEQAPEEKRMRFRFLHISTDEVYGSLSADGMPFTEASLYSPNSPYAASKAAADHMVRAVHHTYSLPVLTVHCSNNYGPFQFPEKMIPRMIHHALAGVGLPVYGDGLQIRDWLHVSDHCSAIRLVLESGRIGHSYNVGASNERRNIELVMMLCTILDELKPRVDGNSYSTQIRFVADRPGHDRRYAIDASRLKTELGWEPKETFESGLRKTIQWYIDNQDWVASVVDAEFTSRLEIQYG